jgi:hypothetical protein
MIKGPNLEERGRLGEREREREREGWGLLCG